MLRLVASGERVDPGDRAPRRRLRRAPNGRSTPARCGAPGTTAATVTTCSSWPRLASSWTMRRHHDAGRRRVGLEVRAQHDDPHRAPPGGRRRPAPRPDASSVNWRGVCGRPRPARRAGRSPRQRPPPRSRAVGAGSDQHGGVAHDFAHGRLGAADDRRVEHHRLDQGSSEAFVLAGKDHRHGACDQRVPLGVGHAGPARTTRSARPRSRTADITSASAAPAPPVSTSARSPSSAVIISTSAA